MHGYKHCQGDPRHHHLHSFDIRVSIELVVADAADRVCEIFDKDLAKILSAFLEVQTAKVESFNQLFGFFKEF